MKKLSAGERFAASTQGLLQTAALLDHLYAADQGVRFPRNVEARAGIEPACKDLQSSA